MYYLPCIYSDINLSEQIKNSCGYDCYEPARYETARQHSECLQRGRMSQERLLGSLCAACQLPPPLYDLEVTGGDQVTVCCVVGRSDII